MRKWIGAGLAALLLSAAIPSHADALGGRRGGSRKSAKSSRSSTGASWAQPKASGKRGGAKKNGKGGVGVASSLPQVSVPAVTAGGGGRRSRSAATAVAKVDYKAKPDAGRKRAKLTDGGIHGAPAKASGGGGKKRGKG